MTGAWICPLLTVGFLHSAASCVTYLFSRRRNHEPLLTRLQAAAYMLYNTIVTSYYYGRQPACSGQKKWDSSSSSILDCFETNQFGEMLGIRPSRPLMQHILQTPIKSIYDRQQTTGRLFGQEQLTVVNENVVAWPTSIYWSYNSGNY